jgi:hypothetical protein
MTAVTSQVGCSLLSTNYGHSRSNLSAAVFCPSRRHAILLAIGAAMALLHLQTNNRYGFHRDELQFPSDARHLDWGCVAYPPVTPFLERIGLRLFGVSLIGLRLFSVVAQSAALGRAGASGGSRLRPHSSPGLHCAEACSSRSPSRRVRVG